MTYTKEQKYEHDGGRSQGTMMNRCRQPYHPAAQDRLPTEAKQG